MQSTELIQLIERLESLYKKTTPGDWENETESIRPERSAYESVFNQQGQVLFDTVNSEVAEIHEDLDFDNAHYWDDVGRNNLAFVCAVHNAFPKLIDSLLSVVDCRVGVRVRPVWTAERRDYRRGICVEVHPNGSAGIIDPKGVLKIQRGDDLILAGASDWESDS